MSSPYNAPLIFLIIYVAMIANSYWEASAEGRNAWDKNKSGWKIKLGNKYVLTSYHFFLFIVMWPLLLTLPLVVNGWDTRLFGILASAYVTGLSVEDFFWFVVNPEVKVKEFGPKFVDYYPWIRIGKINIPLGYAISFVLGLVFWFIFWK